MDPGNAECKDSSQRDAASQMTYLENPRMLPKGSLGRTRRTGMRADGIGELCCKASIGTTTVVGTNDMCFGVARGG